MKVWDVQSAFSNFFFQLTCRPGAVVFVLRKKSSMRVQLWTTHLCNGVCSFDFQITLSCLKTAEIGFQPRTLEQSWEMKPCLSVIVTEEGSLISQRYYPPPWLASLPPPPSYIVPQDQVHGGRGWRRVMGPLSLCLRAGWMGLGPCPHTGFLNRTPLVISLLSSFLRPARLPVSPYPYFKVFRFHVHMSTQHLPATSTGSSAPACLECLYEVVVVFDVVTQVFISKQLLTNQEKYQEKNCHSFSAVSSSPPPVGLANLVRVNLL